ncbi:astacin-like metalloprotease toxin 5 isoform X2 [Parasteatoda tepidariorum]
MFGGDMILPSHRMLRNGILSEDYRWPGYPGAAFIPFIIDSSLEDEKKLILEGMEAYHKTTCVKFVPRTTEREYVKIYKGEGCFSAVGRDRESVQPQELSLAPGCLNIGTIIHELGHTIGFYHEQNRSDRDEFLIVHMNNIPSYQRHNFRKLKMDENILLTPFDYDSIMIYGNYAFSKNPDEAMTIEAKTGQLLYDPFKKVNLTLSDIDRVNKMYKC